MGTQLAHPQPSLGPLEYRVLGHLSQSRTNSLVRRRDQEWLLSISPRADRVIDRLAAKGRLVAVAAGRYVAPRLGVDLEAGDLQVREALEAWLAGYPYYVGFHTALSEFGFTDLDDPTTYLMVRGDQPLPRRIGAFADTKVKVLRMVSADHWFGLERMSLGDVGAYWRSDAERTLLDALGRPTCSGSMQTVLRSWTRAVRREAVNLRRLCRYAVQLGPATVRRAGFWLTELGVPQKYTDELWKHRSRMGPIKLDPDGATVTDRRVDWHWGVHINVPSASYRGWIEYGK